MTRIGCILSPRITYIFFYFAREMTEMIIEYQLTIISPRLIFANCRIKEQKIEKMSNIWAIMRTVARIVP
jgi:hypothetical protein